MEITYIPLDKRLKKARRESAAIYRFHRDNQKKIDLIEKNDWLISQEKAVVKCKIDTFSYPDLTIHISNVPIEEFIENILGLFHEKFGYFWKLELEGQVDDPVFVFTDIDKYWSDIKFRVKEGEFTSCTFEKRFSHATKPEASRPVYKIEMICE